MVICMNIAPQVVPFPVFILPIPAHPDWIHVYTDDSVNLDSKQTGTGVFCYFFQLRRVTE